MMARAAVRYVALLRGINVGGHRVSMADLRGHFEENGFTNVETFIASGNVIFDAAVNANSAALEQRIERMLHNALGYDVSTFLRTATELAAVATHAPFSKQDSAAAGHRIHVGFLRAPHTSAFARELLALTTTYDAFAVNGREMYWLTRGNFSDSQVPWVKFEKRLTLDVTMRNLNTVQKLVDKYSVSTR